MARIGTLAPQGIQAEEILVEVAARPGLSSLSIVGMAGRTVVESKERIKMALRSMGVTLPSTSIVVNLAPAALVKDGTHYDLPIALALLQAIGVIKQAWPKNTYVIGELGLTGELRRIKNAITFAGVAKRNNHYLIFPKAVLPEVSLVGGIKGLSASSISELLQKLTENYVKFDHIPVKETISPVESPDITLDDLVGQPVAKRTATISAAGFHNLLLTGPPGVGKTMLAQTTRHLLPPLSSLERQECTEIYSAAGLLTEKSPVVEKRPFRAPHHDTPVTAVVGGGSSIHPGEISLAHRGILMLDELPLFKREVLDSLREPLETGVITISRKGYPITLPARFLMIGTLNPCPCGWYGVVDHKCRCQPHQIDAYMRRLSGPLLDRCGLYVRCANVKSLDSSDDGLTHEKAKLQIEKAWKRQKKRQKGRLNNELTGLEARGLIDTYNLKEVLDRYVRLRPISVRARLQAVKVALTIADLSEEELNSDHLTEALYLLPPTAN